MRQIYLSLSGTVVPHSVKQRRIMTKLSVNINKIAVVRSSRGGNLPDVVRAALDIERFGAEGITVHPRPDARHIRYDDVRDLKRALTTELNIEGQPHPGFDRPGAGGGPCAGDAGSRRPRCHHLERRVGLRPTRAFLTRRDGALPREGASGVSVFVDPVAEMVAGAKACGADRVELYTEA